MKRLFLLLTPIVLLTSCYFEEVQPRYDDRDRIVGYYDVEEYSNTYHDLTYYSFRVGKSGYHDEIYIDNFYAADIRVYARISYNTITIHSQVVNGYEVEGTGTIFGNEIELNYRVRDRYNNSYTDFCETTATFDY
jgi:hypothetical protein